MSDMLFDTVYGHNLVAELRHFCHRPYLVVTMRDIWHKFERHFDEHMAGVYFVETLDHDALERAIGELPACSSVIGLGGGQALDVAKFVSWSRRLPLFQVPTAMTVDAAFGHRIAVRFSGQVRYIGWAIPESVYVDLDVIQDAPPALNRSGIGDILCYHTARIDWKLAHERGTVEQQWPYDQALVDQASRVLETVLRDLDEIRDVTDRGVHTLMEALRWGGAAYHNAGWNGRHIEGVEHFFLYALEYLTGRRFIHGQPVCLGVYIGSAMQDNAAEKMLAAIHRAGVDIRAEAMNITWEDVSRTLYQLRSYVEKAGLWYTVANETTITDQFIYHVRDRVEQTFGPWTERQT
jgi:glycerol dehydrogenase-like iron-containing ADH family enzyme